MIPKAHLDKRIKLRLAVVLAVLGAVISTGTIGYRILEGWSWLDSFYMTVIGLTTVGFTEVHPLSHAGRLFTAGLLVLGIGAVAFGVINLGHGFMLGTIERITRRSSMKEIEALQNHIIVCGYGRLGRHLVRFLSEKGLRFVIIDREPGRAAAAVDSGHLVLESEACEEEVLIKAGLDRADAVIAAVGSDSDNISITLSVKDLNPSCTVVARAEDPSAEKKLRRAGADKVVSPLKMGGYRMSTAVAETAVYDLVERLAMNPEIDVETRGVTVGDESRFSGQTLAESGIRHDFGLIIVAVQRVSGQIVFNPEAETVIEPGDTLITMGGAEQVKRLQQVASGFS
jgi:voltage-gated potassium channel